MNHVDRVNDLQSRFNATADVRRKAETAARVAATYLHETACACQALNGRDFEVRQRGDQSIMAMIAKLEVVKASVAELEVLLPTIPTAWAAA